MEEFENIWDDKIKLKKQKISIQYSAIVIRIKTLPEEIGLPLSEEG